MAPERVKPAITGSVTEPSEKEMMERSSGTSLGEDDSHGSSTNREQSILEGLEVRSARPGLGGVVRWEREFKRGSRRRGSTLDVVRTRKQAIFSTPTS